MRARASARKSGAKRLVKSCGVETGRSARSTVETGRSAWAAGGNGQECPFYGRARARERVLWKKYGPGCRG